jgi:hypothetical protein
MRYYYTNELNNSCGPVEESVLHELYAAGNVTSQSSIIQEGGSEWVNYESHYGLNSTQKIAAQRHATLPAIASGPHDDSSSMPTAKDKIQAASKDALHAFKTLLTDPVNGLSEAFESLGEKRARSVGMIFGFCFALIIVFVLYKNMSSGAMTFEIALKVLLASLVPYIGLTVGCAVARMISGKGNLSHDCFIGGSVLLPLTFFILIGSFLGIGNIEIVLILALFTVCLTVLLLFSGLTKISKISERVATISVPLVILIAIWAAKIIYAEVIEKYISNMLNYLY